ncbi:MAG: glycine dehydrogenase, partial [Halobacteriales archaeon]
YAESPTVRGTVEERLDDVGDVADDVGALFVLGSDPVSLSLLAEPEPAGVDVVVGDASVLGLPTSYGMGLGLFATREEFVRQVPGRLVGASEDDAGNRAYTLTLQTREQHIRKERATSNICTNQAWVALRTAMHAFSLGPDGLLELAKENVRLAEETAARVGEIDGVIAPVHDRHHVREFVARTERPAGDVAADLAAAGYAIHEIDDHLIQIAVTDTNAGKVDELVGALKGVAR